MIKLIHNYLEQSKIYVLLVKKETIDVVLLAIREMITGLHQDLEETGTRALLVRKMDHQENLLDLKKNLMVVKKNHLTNFQKNLGNL
jgi:hypothetical protein